MDRFVRIAVVGAVIVRIAAAVVLVVGPWTDEPSELEGWDIERFYEIAQEPGRAWVDHQVEYPPAAVAIIEMVGLGTVVDAHRVLVVLSLAIDLATAAVIGRVWGRKPMSAYLLLGVPLIPMGLLRLDTWSVFAAVAAVSVWFSVRHRPNRYPATERRQLLGFGFLVALGSMIKIWPALLISGVMVDTRRGQRFSAAAIGVGATAGAIWVIYAGMSIDPLVQVVSLRGATGWHVESTVGSALAILGDDVVRLELNAYRIGELNPWFSGVGRLVAVLVIVAATRAGRRATARAALDTPAALGLVMTASVSILLVTSPLLSPQFLLWLTPWVALSAANQLVIALAAGAITTTGVTLSLYPPPELGSRLPASLMFGRNVLLVILCIACVRALQAAVKQTEMTGQKSEPPTMHDWCEA